MFNARVVHSLTRNNKECAAALRELNRPQKQEPGTYPGQTGPEVPSHSHPEVEMPSRRELPDKDIPEWPAPAKEIPPILTSAR